MTSRTRGMEGCVGMVCMCLVVLGMNLHQVTAQDCAGGCAPKPCRDTSCVNSVCTYTNSSDGSLCDDGDPTTNQDTCTAGVCKGTDLCANVTCTAPNQCMQNIGCNPYSGRCDFFQKADGAACDDEDPNTQLDSCQQGTCQGVDLCAGSVCDGTDPCRRSVGYCNSENGTCVFPALDDGSPCDDRNVLTENDKCWSGTCIGTYKCANQSCLAKDPCQTAWCDGGSGQCVWGNRTDGTWCDDGNAATANDSCSSGWCVGQPILLSGKCAGVTCRAIGQCNAVGTCDDATGNCSTPIALDGTKCDDGDPRTVYDVCNNGTCMGASLCANISCLTSVGSDCLFIVPCNFSTGACGRTYAPNGTPCNDGDTRTSGDKCFEGSCAGVSTCTAAQVAACKPINDCYDIGACDPASGTCPPVLRPDGTECNDNNVNTTNDRCSKGQCVGQPLGQDPCVNFTCPPSPVQCRVAPNCSQANGQGQNICAWLVAPDNTTCDDANVATVNDVCTGGVCRGTDLCATVNCLSNSSACAYASRCNSTDGTCSVTGPVPDGVSCDDGNATTVGDKCVAGTCWGIDVCDGFCTNNGTCSFVNNAPTCACVGNFTGLRCEAALGPCGATECVVVNPRVSACNTTALNWCLLNAIKTGGNCATAIQCAAQATCPDVVTLYCGRCPNSGSITECGSQTGNAQCSQFYANCLKSAGNPKQYATACDFTKSFVGCASNTGCSDIVRFACGSGTAACAATITACAAYPAQVDAEPLSLDALLFHARESERLAAASTSPVALGVVFVAALSVLAIGVAVGVRVRARRQAAAQGVEYAGLVDEEMH